MAQNVTLMGANYADVGAVELPKTGGGVALFADPSGTTATAEDVTYPKQFLNASGELITGMRGYEPGTWEALVNRIRQGDLPAVGTQIEDEWTDRNGVTYTAVWDIVDYSGGYMYLQWHYCLTENIPSDAEEALYYVGESGLPAGTYHIGIGFTNSSWSASKNIQFTLSQACDPGDQMCIDVTALNTDPTANKTITVYGYGSATAKQTARTSNGTSGTKLGTVAGVSTTNGNVNAANRVFNGYNRWSQSAIRQYLNANSSSGNWWSPQNPWDRPPAYAAWPGFLSGFSQDFLDVIESVPIVTSINTAEGSSDTSETTNDRSFVAALEQINTTPDVSDHREGNPWQYYVDLATSAGYSGYMPLTAVTARKKYKLSAQTTANNMWLRSPGPGSTSNSRRISASGEITNGGNKYDTNSACPVFAISIQ